MSNLLHEADAAIIKVALTKLPDLTPWGLSVRYADKLKRAEVATAIAYLRRCRPTTKPKHRLNLRFPRLFRFASEISLANFFSLV